MNRVERFVDRLLNPPKDRRLVDDIDRLIAWIHSYQVSFFLLMAAALFIVNLVGF